MISRLSSRYLQYLPTHTSLLYLNMVRGLSADQTKALLEGLPEAVQKHGTLSDALVEHLAELDGEKAIATARRLEGRMLGVVFATLAKEDAPAALLRISDLPKNEWLLALSGPYALKGTGIRGDHKALLGSLQSNPKLQEVFFAQPNMFLGCLAGVISNRSSNPSEAVQEFSRASQNWIKSRYPDTDVFESLSESLLNKTYSNLWDRSPEIASRFLDQVPRSMQELFALLEVSSRLKSRGVESALQYVEKLQSEDQIKAASAGLWRGLAQSDQAAAAAWIGQLPEGPVKEGVLNGVAWNAAIELLNDWEGTLAALISAAQTLPPEHHVAYYSAIARPGAFVDSGHLQEFIDAVPLSFEKNRR